MKSAIKMSAEIRAKKKKMMDDRSVIDSGGSPSMDLQDEEIMKRDEITEDLDHNDPKHHSEEPSDEKTMKRKARIKMMMGK